MGMLFAPGTGFLIGLYLGAFLFDVYAYEGEVSSLFWDWLVAI